MKEQESVLSNLAQCSDQREEIVAVQPEQEGGKSTSLIDDLKPAWNNGRKTKQEQGAYDERVQSFWL